MPSEITYDLTAKISLLPTGLGGRKKAVFTGYKPSFSFNTQNHFSGEVHLIDSEELKPGNSGRAVIKLLPSRLIRKTLKPNDVFIIVEGDKTVGTGIIEKVKLK